MKIRVGVIFGGETVEHEVSVISAIQAMNFMDPEKYEIVPIYIDKNRTWYTGKMLQDIELYKDFESLKKYAKVVTLIKSNGSFFLTSSKGLFRRNIAEIDIAFPIVHGKGVEDGSLAGYLDTVGIPYVGPGILGAAIGQDKVIQKQILETAKINIPKYTWFWDNDYFVNKNEVLTNIKNIGYPVIIKPANLGSSVGITVVKDESNIENAVEEAIKYDNKILVEEVIPNLLEVNCSVLGNYEHVKASAIAQMMTINDFLTYEDKYVGEGKNKSVGKGPQSGKMSTGQMKIPADLPQSLEDEVKQMAMDTFKILNLNGVARVDFLINEKTNEVYVNEPNTIPGSLSFYMWTVIGKEYKELLDDMINMTIKQYKQNIKKTTSFDVNILSNFNGSKGLKGTKGKL